MLPNESANLPVIHVFSGGPGSEREVSRKSAENLRVAAASAGYPVRTVSVTPDLRWDFGDAVFDEREGASRIRDCGGIAFPAIHGEYGEDGAVQSVWESAGVAFVGSPSESMRLTIDKQRCGEFLASRWFRTPRSFSVRKGSDPDSLPLDFPAIVKPKDEGSSVSLYKPKNRRELASVLSEEFRKRDEILVQEFVAGREFTCAVVEKDGVATALVPTEIVLTGGELFDYDAKYRKGACLEITPADILPETARRIRELAVAVHAACGCRDFSRTDMILNESGELVVLEINAVPGMTETSFLPAQLSAAGSSMEAFVRECAESAVRRSGGSR